MIEWCNTNAGFATSILTLVYVLATLIIVGIMVHGNKLNRKATETYAILNGFYPRKIGPLF